MCSDCRQLLPDFVVMTIVAVHLNVIAIIVKDIGVNSKLNASIHICQFS